MSTKKVEAYKTYKKNKKSILKKEKAKKRLGSLVAILCAVVIVGWLGWSVYAKVTYVEPDGSGTAVNFTDFDNYVNELPASYNGWSESED